MQQYIIKYILDFVYSLFVRHTKMSTHIRKRAKLKTRSACCFTFSNSFEIGSHVAHTILKHGIM